MESGSWVSDIQIVTVVSSKLNSSNLFPVLDDREGRVAAHHRLHLLFVQRFDVEVILVALSSRNGKNLGEIAAIWHGGVDRCKHLFVFLPAKLNSVTRYDLLKT